MDKFFSSGKAVSARSFYELCEKTQIGGEKCFSETDDHNWESAGSAPPLDVEIGDNFLNTAEGSASSSPPSASSASSSASASASSSSSASPSASSSASLPASSAPSSFTPPAFCRSSLFDVASELQKDSAKYAEAGEPFVAAQIARIAQKIEKKKKLTQYNFFPLLAEYAGNLQERTGPPSLRNNGLPKAKKRGRPRTEAGGASAMKRKRRSKKSVSENANEDSKENSKLTGSSIHKSNEGR